MNRTYRSARAQALGAWVASTLEGRRRKGLRYSEIGAAALLTAAAMGAAQAQVKIGTNPTTINPGSVLELESATRGVLMPRMALPDSLTWSLAGNQPVEGMMVYNTTATSGVNGLQEGMAVWKNGRWISVDETPYFHVNSTVTGNSTLANSGATGLNATAAGPNATASGENSFAGGMGATASTTNGVALGANAIASNGGVVAVGVSSVASAQNTIAIGASANASVRLGIAIGGASRSAGNGAIAIGDASSSTGAYNVALGMIANASGTAYATAVGYNAQASQTSATALGVNSVASAYRATALGRNATASGESSLAAGSGAVASGLYSVAQGFEANASVDGGVALGSQSISNRAIAGMQGTIPAGTNFVVPYNTSDRTLLGAVSVGSATTYRQIINVADGMRSATTTRSTRTMRS